VFQFQYGAIIRIDCNVVTTIFNPCFNSNMVRL